MRTIHAAKLAMFVLATVITIISMTSCGNSKANDYYIEKESHYDINGKNIVEYTYEYEFDNNWNMTKETMLKGDEIQSVRNFEYDDSGKLQIVRYPRNKTDLYLQYEYNYDGIETGRKYYSPSVENDNYCRTECYKDGRPKSHTWYNGESGEIIKYERLDDQSYILVKVIEYDEDGHIKSYFKSKVEERDRNNNPTLVSDYDKDGKKLGTVRFTWKKSKDLEK